MTIDRYYAFKIFKKGAPENPFAFVARFVNSVPEGAPVISDAAGDRYCEKAIPLGMAHTNPHIDEIINAVADHEAGEWDESAEGYGPLTILTEEQISPPPIKAPLAEAYLVELYRLSSGSKSDEPIAYVARRDGAAELANSIPLDVGKRHANERFFVSELDADHPDYRHILRAASVNGEAMIWDGAAHPGCRFVAPDIIYSEALPFKNGKRACWCAALVENKGQPGKRYLRTIRVTPPNKKAFDPAAGVSYAEYLRKVNHYADHSGTGELWEKDYPNSIPPSLGEKYFSSPIALSEMDEADDDHTRLFEAAQKAEVEVWTAADLEAAKKAFKDGPKAVRDTSGKAYYARLVTNIATGNARIEVFELDAPGCPDFGEFEDWKKRHPDWIREYFAKATSQFEKGLMESSLHGIYQDASRQHRKDWHQKTWTFTGGKGWTKTHPNGVPPWIGVRYLDQRIPLDKLDESNPEHLILLKAGKTAPEETNEPFEAQRLTEEEVERPILPAKHEGNLRAIAETVKEGSDKLPLGILLHGPPGTGKTITARWFAAISGASYFELALADLKKGFLGQSGVKTKELWDSAMNGEGVAVIFFDECESVFARRSGDDSDALSEEITRHVLASWTEATRAKIIVVGATNQVDALDPAILSRFEEKIDLPPPSKEIRTQIIRSVFASKGLGYLVNDCDPGILLEMTQGLSGREIGTLAYKTSKEARIAGRSFPTLEDLLKAGNYKPPATKSSVAQGWDALIIAPETKRALKTACKTIVNHEKYLAKNIGIVKILMLTGPPGTGKSSIAKVMASEGKLNLITVKGSDMKGQWQGRTSPAVERVFQDARNKAPCILFIDEIETVFPSRTGDADTFGKEATTAANREIDVCLLPESPPVLIIGATNHPDQVDSALLNRFTTKFEIGLPDLEARLLIVQNLLAGKPNDLTPEDFRVLAETSEGKSGRSLVNTVAKAENEAITEYEDDIDGLSLHRRHFSELRNA